MSLKTTLRASISWLLTGTGEFGSDTTKSEGAGFGDTALAHGTGDGQADLLFRDRRSIAASGSENLDLSGALTDPLGALCAFAKVKAIEIKAHATNVNNVVVGGHLTAAFVGPFAAADNTVAVPPGGVLMLTAPKDGWAVTPTTADLLQIANSGAGSAVGYDVVIVGTSV